MPVKVRFGGGPLHDLTALVASLDEVILWYDMANRAVFVYLRVDELIYGFHPEMSIDATAKFDEVREHYSPAKSSVILDE